MSNDNVAVVIGKFSLSKGIEPDRTWIEIASGPSAGEGGDFKTEDLEKLIGDFYKERF